jgi:hypothetical protein
MLLRNKLLLLSLVMLFGYGTCRAEEITHADSALAAVNAGTAKVANIVQEYAEAFAKAHSIKQAQLVSSALLSALLISRGLMPHQPPSRIVGISGIIGLAVTILGIVCKFPEDKWIDYITIRSVLPSMLIYLVGEILAPNPAPVAPIMAAVPVVVAPIIAAVQGAIDDSDASPASEVMLRR